MWMPEYGLGHNVYMGFGYLIAAMLFGGLLYFTVRFWLEGDEVGREPATRTEPRKQTRN